jgi:cysteinyl-tRNA synthetase
LVGNNIDAYRFTKATDYIEQMQSVIKRLYEKGFAYVADDGVYFSIDAYKNSGKTYGQLSQITTSSTSEARIQNDEYDKLSAHDFALWKIQKDDDPVWDFELNGKSLKGRPGWHIECSAMSESSLGIPFDIHTGGVDLIFPHHENEIAQSTAGQDEPKLASYFVHSEHMLVDGQKMSKSLNNFLTLKDIQDKNYDPLVLRLLVLQSHYNNQAHFSWDNLDAAKSRLQDLRNMAVLRWQPRKLTHDASTFALEDVAKQIQTCVSNNLDTPGALALLSNVSTQLQVVHIEEDMVDHFEFMLLKIDELLGLDLMSLKDINEEQKALIKARQNAREDKDWATADKIRDQLLADNIAVRDETHGPIWSYLG